MENPVRMDDLGVPLFLETPMCLWKFFFGVWFSDVCFFGVFFREALKTAIEGQMQRKETTLVEILLNQAGMWRQKKPPVGHL